MYDPFLHLRPVFCMGFFARFSTFFRCEKGSLTVIICKLYRSCDWLVRKIWFCFQPTQLSMLTVFIRSCRWLAVVEFFIFGLFVEYSDCLKIVKNKSKIHFLNVFYSYIKVAPMWTWYVETSGKRPRQDVQRRSVFSHMRQRYYNLDSSRNL